MNNKQIIKHFETLGTKKRTTLLLSLTKIDIQKHQDIIDKLSKNQNIKKENEE